MSSKLKIQTIITDDEGNKKTITKEVNVKNLKHLSEAENIAMEFGEATGATVVNEIIKKKNIPLSKKAWKKVCDIAETVKKRLK